MPTVVPPARRSVGSVAEVASPYSHVVAYSREEICKSRPELPAAVVRAALVPLAAAFGPGGCEAVVYLNNWLLATNPAFDLSRESLGAATRELARWFPDRAILVPSVNPALAPRHAAGSNPSDTGSCGADESSFTICSGTEPGERPRISR